MGSGVSHRPLDHLCRAQVRANDLRFALWISCGVGLVENGVQQSHHPIECRLIVAADDDHFRAQEIAHRPSGTGQVRIRHQRRTVTIPGEGAVDHRAQPGALFHRDGRGDDDRVVAAGCSLDGSQHSRQ